MLKSDAEHSLDKIFTSVRVLIPNALRDLCGESFFLTGFSMIIAGIDEAGYGPLLGPLVVGCAAFELPGHPDQPLPCLWKGLGKMVSRSRCRKGQKLHINDSKAVYAPADGLKELERGVVGAGLTLGRACADLEAFLDLVCPTLSQRCRSYPWYVKHAEEAFPIEQDAISLKILANALGMEMTRVQTRLVKLSAQVLLEREYNRMVEATRNKGAALFSIASIHLDQLVRDHAHEGVVIFCDRQGGREHYGHLLRSLFEDWSFEVTQEKSERSEYRLERNGKIARIIFTEKAEGQCMGTALASMLSKYLREALMRRFNAWWTKQLPGLTATAGYYTDGHRFLTDIAPLRASLNIRDADLVRCR